MVAAMPSTEGITNARHTMITRILCLTSHPVRFFTSIASFEQTNDIEHNVDFLNIENYNNLHEQKQ